MEGSTRRVFGLPLQEWASSFLSPKYLPMGIALFLAMYVGMQFVLLLFNAAETADRWAFELTPASVLGLPDIQLVFLGTLVTGAQAYLQYRVDTRPRYLGIILAGIMATGLVLGLYNAGADPLGANPARVAALALVLGIVVLDHLSILSGLGAAAPPVPEAVAAAEPVIDIDADIDRSLAELAAATGPRSAEEELQAEIADLEALAHEAVVEGEEKEKEEEEEIEQDAEFAIKDLDAFETWLDRTSEDKEQPEKDEEKPEKDEEKREGKLRRALRRHKP